MLKVESGRRRQVAIAGQVVDGHTGRALHGALVRMTAAPDEFVNRLAVQARQVRFDNPALDSRRPLVRGPDAGAAAVLEAARTIWADEQAGVVERIGAAWAFLETPGTAVEEQFAAAQAIFDQQQLRADGFKRPDQRRTAGDGAFFFVNVAPGVYDLQATLPGTGSRYGTAIEEGIAVTVDAEENLSGNTVLRLAIPPTMLTGKVVDRGAADGENGIAMAEVRIVGSGEVTFALTDDPVNDQDDERRGRFTFSGLEAGDRAVRVLARGYIRPQEPFQVSLKQGEENEPVLFELDSVG